MEKQTIPKRLKVCCKTGLVKTFENLCQDCSLRQKINAGIRDQILSQALQFKEMFTSDEFTDYISRETADAEKAMTEAFLTAKQADAGHIHPNWEGINELYHWNQQRIITLNQNLNAALEPRPPVKALLYWLRYAGNAESVRKGVEKMYKNHSWKQGSVDNVVNLYHYAGTGHKKDPAKKRENLKGLLPLLTKDEQSKALELFNQQAS